MLNQIVKNNNRIFYEYAEYNKESNTSHLHRGICFDAAVSGKVEKATGNKIEVENLRDLMSNYPVDVIPISQCLNGKKFQTYQNECPVYISAYYKEGWLSKRSAVKIRREIQDLTGINPYGVGSTILQDDYLVPCIYTPLGEQTHIGLFSLKTNSLVVDVYYDYYYYNGEPCCIKLTV